MMPYHPDAHVLLASQRLAEDHAAVQRRRLARRPRPPGPLRRWLAACLTSAAERLLDGPPTTHPRRA